MAADPTRPVPRPDASRTLADMQGDSIMQAAHQAQVTFYLTGQSTGEGLDAVAGLGLRPALFAGYRDLTALRYDFPLVLLPDAGDAGAVRSLTEVFDAALERRGRSPTACATTPSAWSARCAASPRRTAAAAFADVVAGGGAAPYREPPTKVLPTSLARLRARSCRPTPRWRIATPRLPGRLFSHAWAAVQRRKAARFRADLTRLIQKLSDILAADFARSDAGHSAENLRAAIGQPQAQAFDFAAMSRMLASVSPPSLLAGQPPRAHPLAALGAAVAALSSRRRRRPARRRRRCPDTASRSTVAAGRWKPGTSACPGWWS